MLTIFHFCQNGTFEPVHEIQRIFWPKAFFWSIMKMVIRNVPGSAKSMIYAGKSTKRRFSKKALAGIENLFLPSKSIDTWSIWSVKLYLYSQLNLWKRYRARPLLIRPLQVPKYLCNTKKFQSIFFCPRPKEDFHLVISVFVPTQFLFDWH